MKFVRDNASGKRSLWIIAMLAGHCVPSIVLAQTSADTVTRCIFDIGEFGNEAVDMCVRQDLAAEKELKNYPREADELIADCSTRMKAGGWVMVKKCVDRALAKPSEAR